MKKLNLKVSDIIAKFLKEKKIKYIFGIIGSANSHIFDSIKKLGFTKIICVHHEQAACMAMQTYYRTSGSLTAALLTTGGGSTNGVTGVVSAWADSIPGIIISGNENSKYIDLHKEGLIFLVSTTWHTKNSPSSYCKKCNESFEIKLKYKF